MVRARVLRERVPVLRFAVLRGFAAAVERFAAERFAAERFAVELLRDAVVPDDFARVVRDFAAPPRDLVAADFDVVLRLAVERRVALRAGVAAARAGSSSVVHLPDITRCAASATASAMIEPNLVALFTTLLAAC